MRLQTIESAGGALQMPLGQPSN